MRNLLTLALAAALFPEMSEEMREGARDVGAFGEVDWHK